jgi:hypothetical protein
MAERLKECRMAEQQNGWLERMQLDSDNNGPFFCLEHNIQWVDYKTV